MAVKCDKGSSFATCTVILFLCFLAVSASSGFYLRPPPRKFVSTVKVKSDSHPQQVHISMAGEDHMRISYITVDKRIPSVVEYGNVLGKYELLATGESTSYRYFFYKSGKIHHVKIGPLESDTVYYYRCGGVGEDFSFKTPPMTPPVDFVVIGDLGQTEWSASTLAHIKRSTDYDILLSPGDLSYADGQQPLWDTFGRFIQPHASSRPWMVTEGNHEIESLPILRCHSFISYNARWPMPHEESGSNSNLFHSFNVAGGAIHVVMLGSYTEFGVGSDQHNWVKSDLAKVNREKTPWVVVVMHVPWYNTNSAHQGEGESMRSAMEGLLYDSQVDIVFSGHVHAYERFSRVYDNAEDPCGPIHITIGDGGNREGLALIFEKNHKSRPLSLFREASFGHGRLRVLNRTHAHWSWHRNDDLDSTVRDEITFESLTNSHSCHGNNEVSKANETFNISATKEEL